MSSITRSIKLSARSVYAVRAGATRAYASKAKTPGEKDAMESVGDGIKKAAQAFKSDGSIGQKFNPDGSVGSKADAVGGPFSKDGAVGKQFTDKGAVGGLGQSVAENVEEAGKDVKKQA
ncbi:hypothetical protein DB88DRAFT_490473 [Papiliotrema laurentii]|uniref:Uncharacterized protein n=1 Tax=Papiliotrema laurentii TaxID=5418 RepID=A0AAD9CZQ9_PAPLA|nr:hypothetical protein DB88DRAFT_490473 [Papiliotrema laurentii]